MTEMIAARPVVGELAPDFTLNSTAGHPVTLSELRGKQNVLLAFFPLAFTSTCTSEMCAFTDDFDEFTGKNVMVLPISVDAVPSLKEYKKAYSMKVDLLSDFKREASRAYGVLNEASYYAQRSYFLIDKQGVLRWSHVEDKSGMRRENSELLKHIDELAI